MENSLAKAYRPKRLSESLKHVLYRQECSVVRIAYVCLPRGLQTVDHQHGRIAVPLPSIAPAMLNRRVKQKTVTVVVHHWMGRILQQALISRLCFQVDVRCAALCKTRSWWLLSVTKAKSVPIHPVMEAEEHGSCPSFMLH